MNKRLMTSTAFAGFALAVSSAFTPHAQAYFTDQMVTQPSMTVKAARLLAFYGYIAPTYRSQRDRADNRVDTSMEQFYMSGDMEDTDFIPYTKNTLALFERLAIGNTMTVYENNGFSDSEIDFRMLVAHPCYNPVNAEILECMKVFGPFYSFKQTIENGSLRYALITQNDKVSPEVVTLFDIMALQLQTKNAQTSKVQTLANYRATLDNQTSAEGTISSSNDNTMGIFDFSTNDRIEMRAQFVWEVCTGKYPKHGDAFACYLRNERLVTDSDVGLLIEASTFKNLIK